MKEYRELFEAKCAKYNVTNPSQLTFDMRKQFKIELKSESKTETKEKKKERLNEQRKRAKAKIKKLLKSFLAIFATEIKNHLTGKDIDDIIKTYEKIVHIQGPTPKDLKLSLIRRVVAAFPHLAMFLIDPKYKGLKMYETIGAFLASRDFYIFKLLADDGHMKAAHKVLAKFFLDYYHLNGNKINIKRG